MSEGTALSLDPVLDSCRLNTKVRSHTTEKSTTNDCDHDSRHHVVAAGSPYHVITFIDAEGAATLVRSHQRRAGINNVHQTCININPPHNAT